MCIHKWKHALQKRFVLNSKTSKVLYIKIVYTKVFFLQISTSTVSHLTFKNAKEWGRNQCFTSILWTAVQFCVPNLTNGSEDSYRIKIGTVTKLKSLYMYHIYDDTHMQTNLTLCQMSKYLIQDKHSWHL